MPWPGSKQIPRSGAKVSHAHGQLKDIKQLFYCIFRATYDNDRGESIGESIVQSNAAKYRDCEKLMFKCLNCKTENVIVKPFVKIDNKFVPVLERCANKECGAALFTQTDIIRNSLTLAIRKAIRTYYDNWLICDDPNCNQSTRTYVHVRNVKLIYELLQFIDCF